MGCMETDHDEPLFIKHLTLLLSLILPKGSWTKKITFGNKCCGVIKQKLSLFSIKMYRRFGARKNTVPKLNMEVA